MKVQLSPEEFDGTMTRRDVLRHFGIVSVGLAATPVPGFPAWWFTGQDAVVPFTDMPDGFNGLRAQGPEEFAGQNLRAQDLRAVDSWLTPVEDFFAVGHYGYPALDAASWALRVRGLVERPATLTLDELRARPRVERTTVFECSGNSRGTFHGMVGNATWAGTPLLPLLEEAGPMADTRDVHFWAADTGTEEIRGGEYEQKFARSMSMRHVREREPILAYEMNGEPLTVVHGFPVRLIVPGWYGVCQVKWLTDIELSHDRLMTRFMARDYVTLMGHEVDGEVEWVETSVTRQRPKSVVARVTRQGGRMTVFGVAWSDGTPLDRVEVSLDGGAAVAADLESQGDAYTWSFFSAGFPLPAAGEHTVVSRATDTEGRTQPDDLDMKQTRWENNEIFERTIRI